MGQAPLSPDTELTISATETIVYSKTYTLGELEEFAGVTLEECDGNLDAFGQALYEKAHHYADDTGFAEDLERHGDVQGQEWVVSIE